MIKSFFAPRRSFLLGGLFLLACGDKTGAEGGPCYDNGSCDSGLVCLSERCVEDLSSNGTGGSVSTGGRTGGTGGSVASTGATDGDGGSGSGGDQATTGGASSDGGTTSGGAGPTGGSNTGGSSTGGRGDGGSAGSSSMGPATVFEGSGVLLESSDYSIDGSFFILEDSVKDGELVVTPLLLSDLDGDGASAEEPSTFDGAEAPCVSGTIAMVTDPDGESCELVDADCDWTSMWGGGIGLTLNQPEDTALTWDATAEGITGFEFVTSIAASGPPLRFIVEDTSGKQYCTDVAYGSKQVLFDDLVLECWSPQAGSLDPSKIRQISWQFKNDASRDYTINSFCVDELTLLK